MLGKLLDGRYQVDRVLGAGGFGKTYLARDTRRPGNPICVVKQLKPANSDTNFLETARRLFTSEAETLERLGNHDQIPRLLAYFEEDKEFYLVQEFIEGHSLSQELLPGQHWEESRVIELLQEILTVLEFVHRHGVIHRDIKPDNLIRRNSDNKIVLVDFGAVKQVRTQLSSTYGQVSNTVAIGTPGYMASEQAMGQPRPTSDIYGLGVIGIQALTGLMPMQFQDDINTGEILWEQIVPVSKGLANILTRMVRYHFKDRYQSAGEALQALQQIRNNPANPGYPTQQNIPGAREAAPPQRYAPPISQHQTMPVAPAPLPRQQPPTPPPPSRQPASTEKSDGLPLAIGVGIALIVGVGMAYATSQGFWNAFAPGKSGGKTNCIVNNGPLNVRSQPQGDVVDTLAQGATLAISNNKQNGWVETNAPTKGWVFEQYIDCSGKAKVAKTQATPAPEETEATPTPKETKATPTPKETKAGSTPKESPSPKESPDKIKSAIENTKRLAAAAQKYQQGNLDGAIADVESILAENPSFKEAQVQIEQWKKVKAQFDRVQQAYNEGRYVDVLRDASGVNFPGNPYLEQKLNELVQEASKRKNETEGNQTEKTEQEQPPQQTQETPSDNSTPEPDKSP